MLPAITYSHCQGTLRFSSWASSRGPTIEPTPKNPSTVFMIEVCSAVECEISPINASAPVLKIPMATPESAIKTQKNTNELPPAKR